MKNIIKKSLIYQWFYTIKWILLLITVMWSLFSYIFIFSNKIDQFKNEISQFISNKFPVIQIENIIVFIVLLMFIYILGNGIKKRSKIISINSGPYTRDQIFWNNVLCNILVLIFFIFIYLYFGICFKLKYTNLLNYSSNYFSILFLDILKLLSLGLITLSYTLFMDKLFSNSIVTIMTIGLVPVSLFSFFLLNSRIISDTNLLNKFYYFKDMIFIYLNRYQYINDDYLYRLTYSYKFNLIFSIIIIIVSIIILFITKRINKIIRIENISNFFIFKRSKYVISIFLSVLIVSFGLFVFENMIFRSTGFLSFNKVFIFLIFEVLSIIVINFIINKILSNFIK